MQDDNRIVYILKRIWPTVYMIINNAVYFVFTLIRSMVKMAIEQIRNF